MRSANSDFNTFEYLVGQQRPSHPDLLASFEARSAAAKVGSGIKLDLAYGPHPRQKLDVYPAEGVPRGSVLYFHPGYWQSRDKSDFRFLAEAFAKRGFDFVLANYPLCPEVRLDELVEHVAESVPFSFRYLGRDHLTERGLIVAGHSAGGHLAIEMALRNWPTELRGSRPISKIVAISGVFDLEPLVSTPLNEKLQLNDGDARRNSPIHRVQDVGVPATFIVGGAETSEFRRQSHEMCGAWRNAGNPSLYIEVAEADHFSVIDDLSKMQSPSLTAAFER